MRNTRVSKALQISCITLATALAAACGSSSETADNGSTNVASASNGVVSVLVMDHVSDEYSKIWVTLQKVVLVNAADKSEVIVFESAAGQAFNLRELANIGQLLSTESVPAGSYNMIKVTVAGAASLVTNDGQTIEAHFNAENIAQSFDVRTKLDVTADNATSLALDFDLKQFKYDATTGLVTAKIIAKGPEDVNKMARLFGKLRGVVTKIDDSDTFVIETQNRREKLTVTVNLSTTSVVTIPGDTAQTANDTSLLHENDKVVVDGNFEPTTLAVDASAVIVTNNLVGGGHGGGKGEGQTPGADGTPKAHLDGTVKSFDGSTLVVNVTGGSFTPTTSELTIANASNAHIAGGTLATLVADQAIDVLGTWDGTTFTAAVIRIEGAKGSGPGENVVEVKGKVVSVVDKAVTVTIVETRGTDLKVGDQLTFDVTQSHFKQGSAECLAVDAQVNARGSYADSVFTAVNVMVIAEGCARPQPTNDRFKPAPGSRPGKGGRR